MQHTKYTHIYNFATNSYEKDSSAENITRISSQSLGASRNNHQIIQWLHTDFAECPTLPYAKTSKTHNGIESGFTLSVFLFR